jgi:hypothetical protein
MYEEIHENRSKTIWLEPAEYMARLTKRVRKELNALSIVEEMVEGEFGQTCLTGQEQMEMVCILNKMMKRHKKDMGEAKGFYTRNGYVPERQDLLREFPERN